VSEPLTGLWPSLLLVGPTGSGKTPLGDEIEKRGFGGRRCVHLDFGANLRSIAAGPGSLKMISPDEVAAIRSSLATGALFEERDMPMIVRIVERFAGEKNLEPGDLLVLNGLPRHVGQAESLAAVISVERVVELDASAAVIRERMRLDPGGDRAVRRDDSLAAVEKRLTDFWERTLPLIDHYRGLGVPVHVIPVTAAMTAGEMKDVIASVMRGEGGGRL
jgi:adenylate kinase